MPLRYLVCVRGSHDKSHGREDNLKGMRYSRVLEAESAGLRSMRWRGGWGVWWKKGDGGAREGGGEDGAMVANNT